MSIERIYSFTDPTGSKYVGDYDTKTHRLEVRRDSAKHRMRIDGTYGIGEDALLKAQSLGCETVALYVDGYLSFTTHLSAWLKAPLHTYSAGRQHFMGPKEKSVNTSRLERGILAKRA